MPRGRAFAPCPPRPIATLDSGVIGGKSAIVRNSGTLLQQLTQRIRTAAAPVVKSATTPSDELQGRRRQCRLGETPPRDAGLIGARPWSAVVINVRGEEALILHTREHIMADYVMSPGFWSSHREVL